MRKRHQFTDAEVANFERFIQASMSHIAAATGFLDVLRLAIKGQATIQDPPDRKAKKSPRRKQRK